jgi:catechol-2,3-dioxygenase
MKRIHVNVKVHNLQSSVAFYSALFGTTPSVQKPDYAKWLLAEPALNFSISHSTTDTGIEHLGLQVDTEEELAELRLRASAAEGKRIEEGHTVCCYAKSDKTWLEDPQGVSWELFRTYGQSDTNRSTEQVAACCEPSCCTAAGALQATDK